MKRLKFLNGCVRNFIPKIPGCLSTKMYYNSSNTETGYVFVRRTRISWLFVEWMNPGHDPDNLVSRRSRRLFPAGGESLDHVYKIMNQPMQTDTSILTKYSVGNVTPIGNILLNTTYLRNWNMLTKFYLVSATWIYLFIKMPTKETALYSWET